MHFAFGPEDQAEFAILIKTAAMQKDAIQEYYLDYFSKHGVPAEKIMAFSLAYTDKDKAPAKLMNSHLESLGKMLKHLGITHVLVADGHYFKKIAKVRKADPNYGYALPSIWDGITCAITINHRSLFYNPRQIKKLHLGVDTIINHYREGTVHSFGSVLQDPIYLRVEHVPQIKTELQKLHKYSALTLDVETTSLDIGKADILTVAFAWDRHHGVAIEVTSGRVQQLLRAFLEAYQGTMVYHNAPFDTKMLIWHLWMEHSRDISGMLYGLDILHRDLEDTRILTYLATNSTAGNQLGLKEQAFEFTGNYALDDIDDAASLDRDDLLEYNLVDACATWYAHDKHRAVVRDEQETVYQELFKPALKVITYMEMLGMPLDPEEVEDTHRDLEDFASIYMDKILTSPWVQQFSEFYRAYQAIEATLKLKKKVKTSDDFADYQFNPGSDKQVRMLLFEFLELPEMGKTKSGLPSTDGKSLKKLKQLLMTQYDIGEHEL
jgi:DNA polymerase-1